MKRTKRFSPVSDWRHMAVIALALAGATTACAGATTAPELERGVTQDALVASAQLTFGGCARSDHVKAVTGVVVL